MPFVTLIVPQHEITVGRPIANEIMEDVRTAMGLSSDMEIQLADKLEGKPRPGTTLTDSNNEVENSAAVKANIIRATVKETYTEDGIMTSVVYRPGHKALFIDSAIGLYIKPVYGTTMLEFDITINFRNRSDLMALRRRLRLSGGLPQAHVKHAVRYNYGLPDTVALFLHTTWTLRENMGGYGETLQEYLDNHFIQGRITRSSMDGKTNRLAIDEIQTGIFGLYGDEVYYNEVEASDNVFQMTLTYKVQYEQILGLTMQYPKVIHNQPIPAYYDEWWQPKEVVSSMPSMPVGYPLPKTMPLILGQTPEGGGIRIDPTDEWFPTNVPYNTRSILFTPLYIEPGNENALFHIDDFTDAELPPIVKFYLETFPTQITELGSGLPYYIQAFRVNEIEEEITLSISDTGHVTSVIPMDVRRRNYLRVSMMVDLSSISMEHSLYLCKNPNIAEGVFNLNYGEVFLNTDGWLTTTPDKSQILPTEFKKSVQRMPTTHSRYKESSRYREHAVQYGSVTVHAQLPR